MNLKRKKILEDDSKFIWHPFTQMQTAPEPIVVKRAEGTLLWDENGKSYIDAISSWWVNLHGHAHPHLAACIYRQAKELEHVIFAGFTHEPAATLGRRLADHTPPSHHRIFFSDNGSTAVEVGIKMAIQYLYNTGRVSANDKPVIVNLDSAYHGDTFGSMAVSARSTFSKPFHPFLFDTAEIPAPVPGEEDKCLEVLRNILDSDKPAILVYEPLIQGAGGMRMYKPEALQAMLKLADDCGAVLVADEVMTGFYRTGSFFAGDQAAVQPHIISMSKGLTGGAMALGVTSCADEIYDAFLSEDHTRTFFHGHSFTANPLACSVALASLDLLESPSCLTAIKRIEARQKAALGLFKNSPFTANARQTGTIIAFEIEDGSTSSYFHTKRNWLYDFFIDRGLLLRPLGNTIYVMPPYCITDEELDKVYEGIGECLQVMSKEQLSKI